MKYSNHDFSVTLWLPKSRLIDDAIPALFSFEIEGGQHVICPVI